MTVGWVMEDSLVVEVGGVVGVVWDGDELARAEQEVQHHVCRFQTSE